MLRLRSGQPRLIHEGTDGRVLLCVQQVVLQTPKAQPPLVLCPDSSSDTLASIMHWFKQPHVLSPSAFRSSPFLPTSLFLALHPPSLSPLPRSPLLLPLLPPSLLIYIFWLFSSSAPCSSGSPPPLPLFWCPSPPSRTVFLSVWSPDQQQQHLGTHWKCWISDHTPDLLHQTLGDGWSSNLDCQKPSRGFHAP